MFEHIDTITLATLLAAAVWTDQRAHRIPNTLVLTMLISGLAVQTIMNGLEGLGMATLGVLAGFAIFLIPYLRGGMAAGDVKLIAAVGAFLGPIPVIVAGGIATLAAVSIVGVLLLRQLYQGVTMTTEQMLTHRFPFAAAIATGVACVLVIQGTL